MTTNIILILVNVAALGTSYAMGNGILIILCIVSTILALVALVRTLEEVGR